MDMMCRCRPITSPTSFWPKSHLDDGEIRLESNFQTFPDRWNTVRGPKDPVAMVQHARSYLAKLRDGCHVTLHAKPQALSIAGERTERCAMEYRGWTSPSSFLHWALQLKHTAVREMSGAQMRGEARIVNHSSGARAQPNKVLDVTGRKAACFDLMT